MCACVDWIGLDFQVVMKLPEVAAFFPRESGRKKISWWEVLRESFALAYHDGCG